MHLYTNEQVVHVVGLMHIILQNMGFNWECPVIASLHAITNLHKREHTVFFIPVRTDYAIMQSASKRLILIIK